MSEAIVGFQAIVECQEILVSQAIDVCQELFPQGKHGVTSTLVVPGDFVSKAVGRCVSCICGVAAILISQLNVSLQPIMVSLVS